MKLNSQGLKEKAVDNITLNKRYSLSYLPQQLLIRYCAYFGSDLSAMQLSIRYPAYCKEAKFAILPTFVRYPTYPAKNDSLFCLLSFAILPTFVRYSTYQPLYSLLILKVNFKY